MASGSDQLVQTILIKLKECNERINKTEPPIDGVYCDMTFDGVACWDYTPANTTAKLLCPYYMMYSKKDTEITDYAYRRCEEDGQWYKQYNTNFGMMADWTNYSTCQGTEEEETTEFSLTDLQIIYTIGYSLSLVALIAAMVIFLYFRKLRCPRNTIHMHLFMSFIFRAIFVFIRDKVQAENEKLRHLEIDKNIGLEGEDLDGDLHDMTMGTPGCKAAFSLIQYFLVANFYWLLVEGVYLHSLITLAVFTERSNIIVYLLLGWGCPVLVVLPWTIVQTQQNKQGCWWENVTSDSFYWIIKGPVMLSVVVNFFLFLNILRVLYTKIRATNAAEAHQYSKLAKSTLVLIPLFGVYYIISVGMYASNDPTMRMIRMYFELTLAPFQGFLVALLYCFMNGEVRAEIKRKWRVRQLSRNLSNHRSTRNGHSQSFSGGGTCNEIREPLRPPARRSNSPKSNRTSSNVKDRILALKKNAFGSNSVNGHVQLGNGSAGQLLPRLSQTDMTDNEPSPQVVCKQVEAQQEQQPGEVAETTPLKAACVEHNVEPFEVEVENNTPIEVAKPKAAPLIRTMEELSQIHDSNSELHTDDVTRPLCSKEQQNVAETEQLVKSVPSKTLVECGGASCSTADISTGAHDCPPSYKDLFPEMKQSSSMSNIETQV